MAEDIREEKNREQEEIRISLPTYEEQQKALWDTLEGFDQKTGVKGKAAGKYTEYDSMDLFGLRDALFLDSDGKTKSFRTMYNAVNDLLTLSVSKGRYFDENGNGMTKDFFECLFTAVSSVNLYLASHSGYRWREKGERRVQIATRISNLLKNLTGEVERVQSTLPAKKARMVEYAREGLTEEEAEERERLLRIDKTSADLLKMAETGEFLQGAGKEENKAAAKEWIISGYTDELRELISGDGVTDDTKESRNNFLAYITDQNNRLLANRVAVSIIVEDDRSATLDMPWMKEELREYIFANISNEQMLVKTTEFADIVKEKVSSFRETNRERIRALESRRDKLISTLHIPEKSADLYDHPMIKEMLTAPEEKEFEEKLKDVKDKVRESDRLIQAYLKEHFSDATRDYVTGRLIDFLGAFRVFASAEKIMDQTEVFCDMMKYTAPGEYIAECSIINMMKDLKIDSVRRDHFVRHITGNKPEALMRVPIELFRSKAEEYAKNVKANSKSFAKRVDAKGRYLSRKQWDEIEKLNLESGETENDSFKEKIEAVMAEVNEEAKISREEYLTGRRYKDALKEPARIKRAAFERDLINKMGEGMDKKFLLCLSGYGEDGYADLKRLDAAYRGTEEQRKAELEESVRLKKERKDYLVHALQKGGVPKKLWKAYTKKFEYLLGGIREITRDMTEDERLHTRRVNLERFGVQTIDEALERITEAGDTLAKAELRPDGTIEDGGEIAEVRESYEKGCAVLKRYDGGKYEEIADILAGIPEIFPAAVNSSEEELEKYIAENIDIKLKAFMDGVMLAGKERTAGEKKGDSFIIPKAVRRQYAFSYIRSIYDGKLKGDAGFFKNQLESYNEKVFSIRPDGSGSIADNIKDAEKVLDKELKKLGKTGAEAVSLKFAVLARIYDMTNDTAAFIKLMDRKALTAYAKNELINTVNAVKENDFSDEIKDKIVKEFTDELPVTDEELAKKRSGIRKRKTSGAADRKAYLGVDTLTTQDIRLGKTLVRVAEKGRRRIKLGTSAYDDMRGRIDKYCSAFELPRMLVDALVEEGCSEAFTDRVTGIMWSNDKLQKHAFAMNKLHGLLTKEFKDDKAMSEEESLMYIISLYGNPDKRSLFETDGGPDVKTLREGKDYKVFRSNYEKLIRLEKGSSSDETLERERLEMSKNLRVMMITGLGTLDVNGKPFNNRLLITDGEKSAHLEKLGDIIERNNRYLDYSARLSELIHKQLETEEKDKGIKYTDHYKDRKTLAIRDYFMGDLVKNLRSKRDFDEKIWGTKLQNAYADKALWENLVFNRNSISDKAYKRFEEKGHEDQTTEANIAEVIKAGTVIFKGCEHKYEGLDEEQKKLFALGLVLMDKGAIGYGTPGTIDLIHAPGIKQEKLKNVREALNEYVSGQPLNVDIDYREAFNKLVNYGETNVFYMEDYAFSETAFNKALQFAQAMNAKRIAFMEKDRDRLNDGYASINTAFVKYGKEEQLHEVDALRDENLSLEDVRDKLIEYVGRDTISGKQIAKEALKTAIKGPRALGTVDKLAAHKIRMSSIKKRLMDMSAQDLKLFVRIMQDRGVIDKSRANPGDGSRLYVEQEKRNALCEALSGDAEIRTSVLEGFDDSASCTRAIINALSFQLRDDVDFRGKDLTKDHYAGNALKRKTLADWDLVERAFEMMDEIKDRRAAVYALSHASDYIRQSGNIAAMEENQKLERDYKNKEDFTQDKFERYIKQQAEKDGEADLKRAVAGYHTLSDKEKALFFTVLTRRDLLDISKKDYKKNFFGIKDRNYVNQAGRDRLIDRYIESSLEGNMGITVRAGIHYDAMKMLFSTQISDRERFDSNKSLESMMAVERNLFFGRNTAIDWKLFKRALNFVNRASEELEYAEGNAQLYRGAGDLSANGHLNMSYSFLRKNFHKTGNQWGRYLGRMFAKNAYESAGKDVLNGLVAGVDIFNATTSFVFGTEKEGLERKGLAWVKSKAEETNSYGKKVIEGNQADFNISPLKLKQKDPVKDPDAYQDIKERIDIIFTQGRTAAGALEEARKLLRDSFAAPLSEHFGSLKPLTASQRIQAETDKDNIVVKAVEHTGEDRSYGDIRDKAVKAVDFGDKIRDKWKLADKLPYMKNLTRLVKYTTQKAVYKYINDNYIGKTIDTGLLKGKTEKQKDEAERKMLIRAADEYAANTLKSLFVSTIGEENADNLFSLDKDFNEFLKPVTDTIKTAVDSVTYAKKCIRHVENIASGIQNLGLLDSSVKSSAGMRDEDNAKLKKAGEERLSEEQSQQVKDIVDKHRGMTGLGGDITAAVQNFNIATELVDFAIETANIAGARLNAGEKVIAKAVKEGIQFALFALRVASDRNSLTKYLLHTESGKAMVSKVREGFVKSGDRSLTDELDEAVKKGRSTGSNALVDIVSDARGYEHTSELVENTTMSMAQSIVFCASSYNPMAETKLMAITVMSIMGLGGDIGSTSPETVEKLFKSFNTAR